MVEERNSNGIEMEVHVVARNIYMVRWFCLSSYNKQNDPEAKEKEVEKDTEKPRSAQKQPIACNQIQKRKR